MPEITVTIPYLLELFIDRPKHFKTLKDSYSCRCGGSFLQNSWRGHRFTNRHFSYVQQQMLINYGIYLKR
jgi:hypothetical protein